MCTRVLDKDIEIKKQQQLADYLGVGLESLPIDRVYKTNQPRRPDDCLCPIDVELALTIAGKKWHHDRGDPMEIIIE